MFIIKKNLLSKIMFTAPETTAKLKKIMIFKYQYRTNSDYF